MTRNVVRMVSGRLAASAVTLMLAAPAMAGDRALIDFIGFSEDGQYFAFEEFGVQDGSGFPYSNIYVLDVSADSWVDGTPVRVQLDDEGARRKRRAARRRAKPPKCSPIWASWRRSTLLR